MVQAGNYSANAGDTRADRNEIAAKYLPLCFSFENGLIRAMVEDSRTKTIKSGSIAVFSVRSKGKMNSSLTGSCSADFARGGTEFWN